MKSVLAHLDVPQPPYRMPRPTAILTGEDREDELRIAPPEQQSPEQQPRPAVEVVREMMERLQKRAEEAKKEIESASSVAKTPEQREREVDAAIESIVGIDVAEQEALKAITLKHGAGKKKLNVLAPDEEGNLRTEEAEPPQETPEEAAPEPVPAREPEAEPEQKSAAEQAAEESQQVLEHLDELRAAQGGSTPEEPAPEPQQDQEENPLDVLQGTVSDEERAAALKSLDDAEQRVNNPELEPPKESEPEPEAQPEPREAMPGRGVMQELLAQEVERFGSLEDPQSLSFFERDLALAESSRRKVLSWWEAVMTKRAETSWKKRSEKVKDLEKKAQDYTKTTWGTFWNPLKYGVRINWHRWREGLVHASWERHADLRARYENARNEAYNKIALRMDTALRIHEEHAERYQQKVDELDEKLDRLVNEVGDTNIAIAQLSEGEERDKLLKFRDGKHEEYRLTARDREENESFWQEENAHVANIQRIKNHILKKAVDNYAVSEPSNVVPLKPRAQRKTLRRRTESAESDAAEAA